MALRKPRGILGLMPLNLVAEFLGKKPEEMSTLIHEDGLPAIRVPTATKHARKISLLGLHAWLAERSENEPLTLAQLETELMRLVERKKQN